MLTYNVEGLGWPARSGRSRDLRRIGEVLAKMRENGSAPDIVLFQEVFRGAAKRAVAATNYPAIAVGPSRTAKSDIPTSGRLPGKAKVQRGEIGLKLTGSGIAIASRYPIIMSATQAYGRRSCAGIDCLSNKGIMLARVMIPGLPGAVDIYNTHMNARGASRAPERRNREAHNRQALEASAFIESTHDDAYPVIFGGDFNMRDSEERWENFSRHQSLSLVHRICAEPASECEVKLSWDADAPWMDTQDLQFFWSGDRLAIRPIKVEAMFDGSPGNPRLSDHDGLLVTYALSWPTAAAPLKLC